MEWKRLAPWNWFSREQRAAPEPPADPIARLRAEMERWFQESSQQLLAGPGFEGVGRLLRPKLDIAEDRKAYRISVEIPGVDRDDVSITVQDDLLVIRGEKRHEREDNEEHAHCIERIYGAFERVLNLPDDADTNAIEATFKNGVLRIRIPKQATAAPAGRRIEIGS